ncbi:MAG: hypothetical protein AB7S36_14355, partial [Planctomycetota bacterium]
MRHNGDELLAAREQGAGEWQLSAPRTPGVYVMVTHAIGLHTGPDEWPFEARLFEVRPDLAESTEWRANRDAEGCHWFGPIPPPPPPQAPKE